MKKLIFYIITIILILAGCNKLEIPVDEINEETNIEQLGETKTLSISAEMPHEPSTRVALTEEEDNSIKLTWEEGDELQLCFVQDDNKVKRVVTVNNITNEGKKASFDVVVPTEFGDNNFDLYGVYGGAGLLDSDPTIAVLPTVSSSVSSLNALSDDEYTMMRFSAKEITGNTGVSVTFQHIGSLFSLILKNATAANMDNMGEARITSTTGGWAYNSVESGKSYNLVTETFLDVETAGNYISLYADGAIAADNTLSFWGWYPPLTDMNWPELTLQLYDKSNVLIGSSSNVKPARTASTDAGKCFYFYAVMNDAGLHFTDNSHTAPLNIEDLTIEGDLRHAASGTDFIGMVYTKAGNVYYNQAQLSGEWAGEVDLGAGSDARIAIDGSDIPHVVYTTSDNMIAYSKGNGATFTTEYIESGNGGRCSRPDIAVDGDGFAHIAYSDTRGGSDYDSYIEIMYAVNSSGAFTKAIIYDGKYESMGFGSYIGNYYEKGSRITLDETGQYCIFSHHLYYDRWSGGTYRSYYATIKTSTAGGSTTGADIFDIAFDGSDVIVLYKVSNTVTSAKLIVGADSNITFSDIEEVATSLSNASTNPATLLTLSTTRVLGGISDGKVFTKHGADEQVTDKTVKSETVVVATQCGGDIYTAYTDSSDDMIRLIKRVE